MSILFLPEGIDWNDKRLSNINIDDANIVVSALYRITLLKKRLEKDNKYWYEIEVSRKKWIKLIGLHYTKVLDALIDVGIIGRSKHYRIQTTTQDGKCKSHWLCEPYRNSIGKALSVPIIINRRSNTFDYDMFLSQYKVIEKKTTIPFSVYDTLRHNIHHNLSINISENDIDRLKTTKVQKGSVQQSLGNTDENIIYMLKNNITPYCSIGAEGQRFFSPLTQVFRYVRPYFITENGENLVEHDVVSSQPIFVWYGCTLLLGHTKDTELWKQHLENGTLYELFMKDMGIVDRDGFKSQHWFKMLYGPVKKQDKLFQLMKKNFPTITDYMVQMKGGFSTNKDKYRRLVLDAQIKESSFMLGKVCRDLLSQHKHMPLYTIHDSILTTKEFSVCTSQTLTEHFRQLNIQPKLKTVDYSSININH